MRTATWIAPLLLLAATAAQAGTPYLGRSPQRTPKEETPSKVSVPGIAQGGETFATAVPIAAIPFVDAGATCNNVDDYYPSCAFAGASTAPDVVYSFRPTQDMCVDMSMCNSGYDTILHVYANDLSNLIACNDDDDDGNCGLRSVLPGVSLTAGTVYYIVVDGWNLDCGEYVLEIVECPPPPPPCVVDCPAGSTPEGEPVCETNYEDTFNGGCNSVPPVFSDLACDDTICAGMGNYDYFGDSFRDTDWYRVVVDEPKVLNWCVTGEAPMIIAIIDGNAGCPDAGDPPILCFAFGDECEPTCCSFAVAPGTYWLFAATSEFAGVPCGSTYVASLTGQECPPVSATPAQWTTVKGLYR